MNKFLPLLFICIAVTCGYACKSRKITESFSSGEALSVSAADSQLTALKHLLPLAEISRVPKGIKVIFPSGILFDVNTSSLSSPAKESLKKLHVFLNEFHESRILVEGHTDITGTTVYNKSLSEKRAASVKDFLVSQGIAPERVTTAGYGEERPIATNSTPEGQERNRRVELFIMP